MPDSAPRSKWQRSKLRESCHTCATSKVRCPKEKPRCSRCKSRGVECEYFLTRRPGRKRAATLAAVPSALGRYATPGTTSGSAPGLELQTDSCGRVPIPEEQPPPVFLPSSGVSHPLHASVVRPPRGGTGNSRGRQPLSPPNAGGSTVAGVFEGLAEVESTAGTYALFDDVAVLSDLLYSPSAGPDATDFVMCSPPALSMEGNTPGEYDSQVRDDADADADSSLAQTKWMHLDVGTSATAWRDHLPAGQALAAGSIPHSDAAPGPLTGSDGSSSAQSSPSSSRPPSSTPSSSSQSPPTPSPRCRCWPRTLDLLRTLSPSSPPLTGAAPTHTSSPAPEAAESTPAAPQALLPGVEDRRGIEAAEGVLACSGSCAAHARDGFLLATAAVAVLRILQRYTVAAARRPATPPPPLPGMFSAAHAAPGGRLAAAAAAAAAVTDRECLPRG